MKKCPPGVLCVENVTLGFIIICLCLILYFIYTLTGKTLTSKNGIITNIKLDNHISENKRGINFPYTNDVLLDPYAPPLRDERYLMPMSGRVPINVLTNVGAVDTSYRQVGILTPLDSKGKILPLMGRPLFVNRDKWQYYSMSDQNNSIKLPISRAGKSCTNEYGCDKLFNSDSVFVEGYNEAFKVTTYDNDTMRYLPFL